MMLAPDERHFNTFLYADGATYAIDYYDNPTDELFAENFEKAWQQIDRNVPQRARETPFRFVLCPVCERAIMTSRAAGARFRCKGCDEGVPGATVALPEFDAALAEVNARLGRHLIDLSGHLQVALIQTEDARAAGIARSQLEAAGYSPLALDDPLAIVLRMEGTDRGVLEPEGELSGWTKVIGEGEYGYDGGNAPEFEAVLGTITAEIGVRSLSLQYDHRVQSAFSAFVGSDYGALEDRLRSQLEANPKDPGLLSALVNTLAAGGRLDEAAQLAQAATLLLNDNADMWATLGRVCLEMDDPAGAVEACERAIAIDPVNRRGTAFLVFALREQGDDEKADTLLARLDGLGGAPWL